jgi:hypothetical protein
MVEHTYRREARKPHNILLEDLPDKPHVSGELGELRIAGEILTISP